MRAIFISYRRDDSEGQAGRLFDDLVEHFGDNSVFMDVVGIEAGRDFRRAIDEHVASCGVLLAVIGRNWLDAKDELGRRRLDDPMDFVRLETASALKRDIPVIPVLVGGASMPHADHLPEDLKELVYRNGVELTHARWDSDVEVLVKALRPYVQVKGATTPPQFQTAPALVQPSRKRPVWILIPVVLVGLLLLLLAVGFVGYALYQDPSDNTVSDQPTPSPINGSGAVKPEPTGTSNNNSATQANVTPDPQETGERALSFEDWQGKWEVRVLIGVQWSEPADMVLSSDQSGIEGKFEEGSIKGAFVNSNFSEVTGTYTEDQPDKPCPEDQRRFTFKLAKHGKTMEGTVRTCDEQVPEMFWKAEKH